MNYANRKAQDLLHTPEGVRDTYGREYAAKQSTIEKIANRIHLYGYEDLQTPSFEYFDVFASEIGTTSSRELFKFFDKEGNTLVLRPDFTPSVARCAAKYYMDEKDPLRFCYQGSAFSNTSDLQGKLKETTQMGAELINDDSAQADGERGRPGALPPGPTHPPAPPVRTRTRGPAPGDPTSRWTRPCSGARCASAPPAPCSRRASTWAGCWCSRRSTRWASAPSPPSTP